jgi:ORF6N domain
MTEAKDAIIVVREQIIQKIVHLRDEKVILDIHLAELYGVETRALKQAVRRNKERFPAVDFMFELTEDEVDAVVSQNVIPHKKYLGGAKPFAFTETGVAMLSSVLKSQTAIEVNIAIMRTFVALRKVSYNYKEIMQILMDMRSQCDAQFEEVFRALEHLIHPPQEPRPRIGFRRKGEQD